MLDKLKSLLDEYSGDYVVGQPDFHLKYAIKDTINYIEKSIIDNEYTAVIDYVKEMVWRCMGHGDCTLFYREYSEGFAELLKRLQQ